MTDDPTTDGVTPERLTRLLKMAQANSINQTENSAATEISESLALLLAAPLPWEDALAQSLPGIIKQIYQELPPLTGKSLAELLQDPATDVAVIRHIKTFTKQKVKSAPSPVEGEAATVIYYAAIAHALVYYDKRVTGLSFDNLKESFAELARNDWLYASLIELFSKAIAVCAQKIEK